MKNLLIVGGSSEIGRSLLDAVSDDYDTIYVHYHSNKEALFPYQERLGKKVHLIEADFLDEKSTKNFSECIKELNITHMVHLPSIRIENQRFAKLTWSDFERSLDSQVRSAYYTLHAVLPQMAKLKYGKIVILLTSCTKWVPPKYLSSYVTSKYALMGLMKSVASEYAEKGITINGVSPSMVETRFLENIPSLVAEQNAANSPLKRNAKPDDIIPMIRFLLSDDSKYITEQNILISGGNII